MYFSNLGDTRAIHVILFFVSFIPLWFASKYRPRIPWIFILCIVGLIFGAIVRNTDWKPDLLIDLYPSMDGTP